VYSLVVARSVESGSEFFDELIEKEVGNFCKSPGQSQMTDKNFYCFTCKPKGRGVPDVGREHCVKCNDEFCFDCFYGNGGYSCDGAGCEKGPLCGACDDYHAFCDVCTETFCYDCFAEKKLGNYCYDCGVETCGDCTKGEFSECEHCEDRFCQACRVKKGVFCSSATCGLPIHPVSYDFVQDLFLLGAKFDAVDSNGRSALHHAAMEFERDSCRLLISLGLDPAALDNSGSSALDCLRVSITDIDGHIDEEGKEAVVQELAERRRAYLQNVCDSNWAKNKDLLMTLVGTGLRPTAQQAAAAAALQAASDKSAKLPGIPRKTKAQNIAYLNQAIFGTEGLLRRVVELIPIDENHPRIVPYLADWAGSSQSQGSDNDSNGY